MTVPSETNEALNIQVIPQYDTISLELNDRINLRFTPSNPIITPEVYFAETGEFLRDVTSVRIMDDDSKWRAYIHSYVVVGFQYTSSTDNYKTCFEIKVPFLIYWFSSISG